MKSQKQLSAILWLLAFLFLVSCSKKETTAPPQAKKGPVKDASTLIESRADYALLDVFPSYPGGDSLFRQFLTEHAAYPQEARNNHVSGKVFASFIVEADGSISHIEILRGIGYGCDEAVAGALGKMPSWSAGMIKKNTVRVKLIAPFEFKI
ncbi:MAG: energy transducer TonB [Bacteroidota bacterium]|jgi:periplasmic protein TonB